MAVGSDNSHDALEKNEEDQAVSIPIIFILSTGHAGGTLLNLLLGVSNSIIGIGESLRTRNLVRVDEQSLFAQQFWGLVVDKMEARGWPFAEIASDDAKSMQFWEDWFVSISGVSQGAILVDKTPALELVRSIVEGVSKINPFFIHLVRDPRAVCYSYMNKQAPMLPQVYSWNRSHKAIENYLAEQKKNSVSVRYEDLSHSPAEVLTNLYEVIGQYYNMDLSADVPSNLSSLKLDNPIFDNVIFAGNRMRHSKNRNQKSIAPDEKFRFAMPNWRWWLITVLCYSQLKFFGYSLKR